MLAERRLRRIVLLGDRNDAIIAHRAIPLALALAAHELGVAVEPHWVASDAVVDDQRLAAFFADFDALWCVPGSPYRDTDNVLRAIRFARERQLPFLGTCGGFQHAVLEYARNVLGWADAEHGESAPQAARQVIVPLSCGLVEVHDAVLLQPGSRLAAAYGQVQIEEGYHCNYGVSLDFLTALRGGPLSAVAHDGAGAVRALELATPAFFVTTLFQPERAALAGRCPPLVRALVAAAGGG